MLKSAISTTTVLCVYVGTCMSMALKTSLFDPSIHCQSTVLVTNIQSHINMDEIVNRVTENTQLHFSVSLGGAVCAKILLNEPLADHGVTQTTTTTTPRTNENYAADRKQNDDKATARKIYLSVNYVRLEQHYPIIWKYQFGVPELSSNCVCECGGRTGKPKRHCQAHRRCSSSSRGLSCVFAHHLYDPYCGSAHWCCEVDIRPIDHNKYTAVAIGEPAGVGVLEFTLRYESSDNHTIRHIRREYAVRLAQQQTIQLIDSHIQATLTNTPNEHRLAHALYYVDEYGTLKNGIPINELHEHSVSKMGWFRWKNHHTNGWHVRNAHGQLQWAHRLRTLDCSTHKYEETYIAEQYVLKKHVNSIDRAGSANNTVQNNVHPGSSVQATRHWIKNVTVNLENEQIMLTQSADHTLLVDLTLNDIQAMVVQMTHAHGVGEFNASIHVDRHGAQYMNITFFNCSGTLMGQVYGAADDTNVVKLSFSVQLSTANKVAQHIMRLPGTGADRWVCLQQTGAPDKRLCHVAEYHARRQHWFVLPEIWSTNTGNCETSASGCIVDNTITELINQLNPKNWFTADMTFAEQLATAFKLVCILLFLVFLIWLCRACVWPLTKCCFGVFNTTNKAKNDEQQQRTVVEIKLDKSDTSLLSTSRTDRV